MCKLWISDASTISYKLIGSLNCIMRRRYVNIPLPEELTKEIEKIIKKGKLGYKTKSEFVKEAVREKIIEFDKIEISKKEKRFW